MLQAIVTKGFGHSNTRPARVKASCAARSIMVSYDSDLSYPDNHRDAAKALAQAMEWQGQWHGGALPNGNGYAFVLVTGDARDGFTVA